MHGDRDGTRTNALHIRKNLNVPLACTVCFYVCVNIYVADTYCCFWSVCVCVFLQNISSLRSQVLRLCCQNICIDIEQSILIYVFMMSLQLMRRVCVLVWRTVFFSEKKVSKAYVVREVEKCSMVERVGK